MDDIILDEGYEDYSDPRFYEVSLCFTFMEMDDCITFEMVSDGEVEDNVGLVESVIEGYGGIAEMEDGTIINLKQFVNAFVIERYAESTRNVTSKFSIVH